MKRSHLLTIVHSTACTLALVVGACSRGPVSPAPTERSSGEGGEAPAQALTFEWEEDRVAWLDAERAPAIARTENKPMLVLYYASWCEDSATFVNNFVPRDDMVDAFKRFTIVRVDVDMGARAVSASAPEIKSVPSVVFFDAAGQRLDITGKDPESPYVYSSEDPEELFDAMARALAAVGAPALERLPTSQMPGEERLAQVRPILDAAQTVCAAYTKKSPHAAACLAMLFSSMNVSEPDTARVNYEKFRHACESTGDCGNLALHTFWGAAPLKAPDLEKARALAATGCKKSKGEVECALGDVFDQVAARLR